MRTRHTCPHVLRSLLLSFTVLSLMPLTARAEHAHDCARYERHVTRLVQRFDKQWGAFRNTRIEPREKEIARLEAALGKYRPMSARLAQLPTEIATLEKANATEIRKIDENKRIITQLEGEIARHKAAGDTKAAALKEKRANLRRTFVANNERKIAPNVAKIAALNKERAHLRRELDAAGLKGKQAEIDRKHQELAGFRKDYDVARSELAFAEEGLELCRQVKSQNEEILRLRQQLRQAGISVGAPGVPVAPQLIPLPAADLGQLDVRVTSARWDAQAQRLAVQVVNRSRYDLTELTCGLQHARTDQGRFAIQKGTCPPGGSAWFISDRLTPRYDFRPPGIHRLLGARGSSSNAAAPPNPAPAQRLVRLPAEDHKLVDIRSRDAKWDAKSGRLSVLVVNRTQYTITEITCTLDDALPDTGTFIPEAGACPPGAARWFVASKLQARQQFRTPNIDGLMGVVVVGRR